MVNAGFLFFYIFYLLLISTAIRRAVAFFQDRKFKKANGCKRPRNVAHVQEPILGLDFLFQCLKSAREGRYIRFAAQRFRKYGYTYITKRLAFETVHTADPENLKFMLATEFNSFKLASIRVGAMAPLFGTGIFTTNGAAWAHSRAILRPSFTKQNMTPLLAMMERHFRMLLRQVPTDGGVFDVQRLFFCFTMDTATEFLMGGSTNTLDPDRHSDAERNFVDDYLNCCFEAVRKIAMGPLQVFSVNRAAAAARKRAWAYVDRFVDDALARRKLRPAAGVDGKGDAAAPTADDGAEYNFLEELSALTTDRAMLRDQVLNVLLASRDTTAALLSNMFYELARQPELYSRLRREVLSNISGELPTEAELNSMAFLRQCINEALRLYPVVPGNTREAACDTVLPVGGGADGRSPIFVKKGTPVFYNLFAMHRREDIFGPRPDEYDPDRWIGLRPGWGFLPFNGGPRICLGREWRETKLSRPRRVHTLTDDAEQFALNEAGYVTARMLQCFETMAPHDVEPWTEFYSLVLCSKNGVQVSVTPAGGLKAQ